MQVLWFNTSTLRLSLQLQVSKLDSLLLHIFNMVLDLSICIPEGYH